MFSLDAKVPRIQELWRRACQTALGGQCVRPQSTIAFRESSCMRISLIICTRNRASQLAKVLQRLCTMERSCERELIVVDNGSTDDTTAVIDDYRGKLDLKSVIERHAGLGRARNRGWRASSGDLIAFTDDDCYPNADFLTAIARSFTENQSLGFVAGRVTLHNSQDYPITIIDRNDPRIFLPSEFVPAGAIAGANLAFRRSALEAVGGFDNYLGTGTRFPAEDIDIVARILAAGWYGAYDPGVVVAHDHGRRDITDVKRLSRQYDRGRGAYYAKCVLDARIRLRAAKNWYWAMLRQPVGVTTRELAGAAEFVLRASSGAALTTARNG